MRRELARIRRWLLGALLVTGLAAAVRVEREWDGFRSPKLGPLSATVETLLGHARLVRLSFDGSADSVWAGIARHGRPIQYAHMPVQLADWDVWTPIAAAPAAFEPPSAGFVLDWHSMQRMRARAIAFATLTLAAGISSTGDPELDRRLPFEEPYRIPDSTAAAIRRAREDGGRLVAVGTTVVRALEHAAARTGRICGGEGLADQRVDANSRLSVVDVILSGTHEPDTSHYQLLRAFPHCQSHRLWRHATDDLVTCFVAILLL